jgi:hypothetical protein
MIKIPINDPNIRQEYYDLISPNVIARIQIALTSIGHLLGEKIDVNDPHFTSLKHITKNIIGKIETSQLPAGNFNKANYENNISIYISSPNNLKLLKLKETYDLFTLLIDPKNNCLFELLTCHPDSLKIMNDQYLNNYSINELTRNILIKSAFDYDNFSRVSNGIKSFFKLKNLVNYCPYCNLVEVRYKQTPFGEIVFSHQLDHFFDKATFPLLGYSMFNLIPSDSNCNVHNKGTIEFTNDYHMNPYSNGFSNSLKFTPHIIGKKVTKIEIKTGEVFGSQRYKQLFGTATIIDENSSLGNVNVFKLHSKYEDRIMEANSVLIQVYKSNNGLKSIQKFLDLLIGVNFEDKYKTWYLENIHTYFDESSHNERAFSKFNRDIHDYYFIDLDRNILNNNIREMINQND